jgi:hypothetical protein
MVVVEGNAQMTADIREPGGIYAPDLTGQFHGATKGQGRGKKAVSLATTAQNPAVKPGVVSCQKLGALQQRGNPGPKLPKSGLVGHILPGKTVDMGKAKPGARRLYKIIVAILEDAPLNPGQP